MKLLASIAALILLAHSSAFAQGAPAADAPPDVRKDEPPPAIKPPSGVPNLAASFDVSPGYYLIPSFRLTEEFDSNIFATSDNRQWDFITRFSPGLSAGYRSEPFTLLINGGFDAAIYARNPDLNDATQGWHVGLDSVYRPIRPLAFGLTVSYLKTETPSTLPIAIGLAPTVLAPATVLEFGLVKATFLTVAPSVAYQFTPNTWGTAAYTYIHDTIEGGVPTTANNVELRLYHQVTRLDTAVLGYRTTVVDNGDPFPTAVDYAPTVGWAHQFTPQIKVTVEGGPLFANDGSVNPNVTARYEQEFQLGRFALGYTRSDGFLLGEPGLVKTETYQASFDWRPLKGLSLTVGPAIQNLWGDQIRYTRFYSLIATATYQILPWLAANATYRYGFQEVSGSGNIPRSIFSLSLEASYPTRVY
jgi:hypothetical protein